jgi:folate-binding protein YgfZ
VADGKSTRAPAGPVAPATPAGPVATLEVGYEALRNGLAAFEFAREIVKVSGPDAEPYLQGQLSQDVVALREGGWAWSLVMQPQGKLVALVRVYRAGGTEFFLDTDAGTGPALVERLVRFRLRTKAEVEQLPWRAIAVRGPRAAGPVQAAASEPAQGATAGRVADVAAPVGSAAGPDHAVARGSVGDEGLLVPFRWDGLAGYDLFGQAPGLLAGVTVVSRDAYEAARIEAGFPRHGAELDERTIAAEAGLVETSVSFTKGCYTGQELIARIDSRGSNVPRRIRGFLLDGHAQPGDELFPDRSGAGKVVGRLTSVALSPRLGWVALGYAARGIEPGQVVYVGPGATARPAEVRSLPLAG